MAGIVKLKRVEEAERNWRCTELLDVRQVKDEPVSVTLECAHQLLKVDGGTRLLCEATETRQCC